MIATAPTVITALGGNTLTVISIVGAYVFGVSGGLAAVKARMDPFGVLVLAATVGLAGGVLRDVLLNVRPTTVFDWRVILAVTLAGATAYALGTPLSRWKASIEAFDAVGLSLFCVIGADVALQNHSGPVPAVMLGTVTAVGGGVTRDILLNRVPAVLREDLYAIPAMLGAAIIAIEFELNVDSIGWYALAAGVCLAVRIVGMVFHVNLPAAKPLGSESRSGEGEEGL